MNHEKFEEIAIEEVNKIKVPIGTPEQWKTAKPKIEKFVKEMDKAVEVFEKENTPKKGK